MVYAYIPTHTKMSFSFLSSFPFSGTKYEFDHIRSQKLRELQRTAREKAIRNFSPSLVSSNESCELVDVKNILVERGVADSTLSHHKNDFSEHLEIKTTDYLIELDLPLFPKREKPRGCKVNVTSIDFYHIIETRSTPESVAEFLLRLIDWIPEYKAIEEQFWQEQEQENLAKKIAFDLLKRASSKILDEKGYEYQVEDKTYFSKARLIINTGRALRTTIEVDLLDNFHDDLVRYLEALPNYEV